MIYLFTFPELHYNIEHIKEISIVLTFNINVNYVKKHFKNQVSLRDMQGYIQVHRLCTPLNNQYMDPTKCFRNKGLKIVVHQCKYFLPFGNI